jgi:ubiquinone/menaquinone biosynthesis C-methylase UbiE
VPDEYSLSASVYDAIYTQMKDYAAEAARVVELFYEYVQMDTRGMGHNFGHDLLDVACGTSLHLAYLQRNFHVTGLDASPSMLLEARKRLADPHIKLYEGDMTNFSLRRVFSLVTCLFSAIGHVRTIEGLNSAVASMAQHTRQGGVVMVEPWIFPENWQDNTVRVNFVPDQKVARIAESRRDGNLALLDFHHFVGWPENTRYFYEHHELGLFTKSEYEEAFRAARFKVHFDEQGLMGRGLFIGVKF